MRTITVRFRSARIWDGFCGISQGPWYEGGRILHGTGERRERVDIGLIERIVEKSRIDVNGEVGLESSSVGARYKL